MKSPPPLNLGPENLRGDAAGQGMGATRANHSSAVSGCHYLEPSDALKMSVNVTHTLHDF